MPRIKHQANPYRSGFELTIANQLKALGIEFEYETRTLSYKLPKRLGKCQDCGSENVVEQKVYTPDFILDNGIIIECKGKFTPSERTKMVQVLKDNPTSDIRILFQRDNWLTKKKKKKYSGWCEQKGITYAIGTVPEGWVNE